MQERADGQGGGQTTGTTSPTEPHVSTGVSAFNIGGMTIH